MGLARGRRGRDSMTGYHDQCSGDSSLQQSSKCAHSRILPCVSADQRDFTVCIMALLQYSMQLANQGCPAPGTSRVRPLAQRHHRIERRVRVSGCLDVDRPDLGQHRGDQGSDESSGGDGRIGFDDAKPWPMMASIVTRGDGALRAGVDQRVAVLAGRL